MEVARVVVGQRSSIAVDDLTDAMRKASYADLFIVRYPADRVEWAFSLSRSLQPSAVFHADTLMYWKLDVGDGHGKPTTTGLAVNTTPDPNGVGELVGRAFSDYANHYAANPLLDRASALDGYREWAMVSSLGGNSLTIAQNGTAIAVATFEESDGCMEILLAGVDPAWQGRGVYSNLLWAVERRSLELGVHTLVISTQAHNVRVQRSWVRHGFTPMAAFNTVHVIVSRDA
jgi:GNAT superfamily N-acetyltransferase